MPQDPSQGKGAPPRKPTGKPAPPKAPPPVMTSHQKSQLGSGFDSSTERRRNSLITAGIPVIKVDAAPALPPARKYDGLSVPLELQGRDVWKAAPAPLQSLAGQRSKPLYDQVIKQFGVTVNPRYVDEPGKPRGHIFVWDVSRAMNCEIPHFVGAKELTLAQTCDWIRHEGPMRGWKRASDFEAFTRANAGLLVVVLPREIRIKHVAIVSPQAEPADGVLRLTGIALRRETAAHPRDMFGARAVDYFFHD